MTQPAVPNLAAAPRPRHHVCIDYCCRPARSAASPKGATTSYVAVMSDRAATPAASLLGTALRDRAIRELHRVGATPQQIPRITSRDFDWLDAVVYVTRDGQVVTLQLDPAAAHALKAHLLALESCARRQHRILHMTDLPVAVPVDDHGNVTSWLPLSAEAVAAILDLDPMT